MRKIYESPLNGWDESATKVHVYALDNEDEYWELNGMSYKEKCDYFDVMSTPKYGVIPGRAYYEYDFNLQGNHMIIYETMALDV